MTAMRAAGAAPPATIPPASQPITPSIVWSELRTSSVLMLESGRAEYTAQLAGRMYLPNDPDLIATAALLDVREAVDDQGKNLAAPTAPPATRPAPASTRPFVRSY